MSGGQFTCGCCGLKRAGAPTAAASGVSVCSDCDGRHGRTAHVAAAVRRLRLGIGQWPAIRVARKLPAGDQDSVLRAAAMLGPPAMKPQMCRGTGRAVGPAIEAIGEALCRNCNRVVAVTTAGRVAEHATEPDA